MTAAPRSDGRRARSRRRRPPGDETVSNYTINFGPQHPAAHGVLRLIMELDGEIVERVDPHIGLLHRGTEKLIEYKTYAQALPYFDRLDYCSPMCMEHSYVLAVEKLMGLEVPLRAQYIRVLMAELTRISNHMLNLGSHVMDVGAMTPNLWLFEVREDTMQLYEAVSGARMHANYFRVGGVHQDIPPKVLDRHRRPSSTSACPTVRGRDQPGRRQPHLQAAQRRHRHGQQGRRHRLGLLRPDDPRRGHPVGPAQVASPTKSMTGWSSTFRSAPSGDCYDRFMVRVEEVRQSARIMRQCLRDMPEGPIGSLDRKVFPPKRAEMKQSMEALIHHFKLYTEGYHVPAGEVYVATESPKGEFGVYLVADGTNKPYRCKIRPTAFSHLQAMDFMMKGHMLADTTAVLGAIDVVFGECDR